MFEPRYVLPIGIVNLAKLTERSRRERAEWPEVAGFGYFDESRSHRRTDYWSLSDS
jgi:hypothetical protein